MTDIEQPKRRRGRPRNAEPRPIKTGDGWSVKTYVEVDGVEILKQISLGTKSKTVARAKCKAIASGKLDVKAASRGETFEQAARRIVAAQKTITEKGRRARLSRLERFAFPVFGDKPPGVVDSTMIKDALHDYADAIGKGKITISVFQLKVDIGSVLGALYSDNLIRENAAERVQMHRDFGGVQSVVAPRIILVDPEFERFARHHLAKPELHEVVVMAVSSRYLGGMRTSDLHAWRWEHISMVDWASALVPRPKTKKDLSGAKRHAMDSDLVGVLHRWWVQEGSPVQGPIFPVRRDRAGSWVVRNGKRQWRKPVKAGDHRTDMSHADTLRDLVWEAGVVRPLPGYDQATTDEARRALCAIQVDSAANACLDFHSFRRAYATAAGQSNLNIQQAMALTDHSDERTHMRYYRPAELLVTPKTMLPNIGPEATGSFLAPDVPKIGSDGKKKSNDCAELPVDDPPLGSRSVRGRQSTPEPVLSGFGDSGDTDKRRESPGQLTHSQNSLPIIRDALGVLAEAVFSATQSGQWDLAADIVALGRKHSAALTPPANVTPINARRR